MKNQTLQNILMNEKTDKTKGGIYHKLQIEMTYNSNHMEGSSLSHDQTRYIFETNTIGLGNTAVNVDDIIETSNHFRCIDAIITHANDTLNETFIKNLHKTLKNATSASRLDWFAIGDYKKLPNEVGGKQTTSPKNVPNAIQNLLKEYNSKTKITLEDIIDFHVKFETIHPFQDCNGRIGRLIMLKECLKNNIVPFIINDDLKLFYYRGLQNWQTEKGYLLDTCLSAQDIFKTYLNYFKISYEQNPK